nr:class I SAM-dependent methyltransferase [Salsipaludibacter albus]
MTPDLDPPLTFGGWLRHDTIVEALAGLPADGRVLEIGPGLGAMGTRIAERHPYLGVERDAESRAVAAQRVEPHGGRVVASLDEVEGNFQVVCAFEVLEHIEDDREALATWVERLARPGRAIFSTPAGPDRMGPWDVVAGHHRRYSPETMWQLLESVGLEVETIRLLGWPVGYVSEWVRNRVAQPESAADITTQTHESGRLLQPNSASGWLTWGLSVPQRVVTDVLRPRRLGTGLVAVARRR